MFAIYWHGRLANGTIGTQGHDIADTLEEAKRKLVVVLNSMKARNMFSSLQAIIDPPGEDELIQSNYSI